MKQKLILTGAGGCMRELLWQIEELNRIENTWEVLGYVDISDEFGDVRIGECLCPYLGTDQYLLDKKEDTNVVICAGSSTLRKKIAEKLMVNPNLKFPNLILSDTRVCTDVEMGQGNIISMDCRVSTNVCIGNFTFLNIGSVVCHDGRLGDYVTLSPDVHLAGAVTVGSESELGMGTRVIQGITIGDQVITGAGSVVIRDLPNACTAVGVPARVRASRKNHLREGSKK